MVVLEEISGVINHLSTECGRDSSLKKQTELLVGLDLLHLSPTDTFNITVIVEKGAGYFLHFVIVNKSH